MSWQHGQLFKVASLGEIYGTVFLLLQGLDAVAYMWVAVSTGQEAGWIVDFYGAGYYSDPSVMLFWHLGLSGLWIGCMQIWRRTAYNLWDKYEKLADHAEKLADITVELHVIRGRR